MSSHCFSPRQMPSWLLRVKKSSIIVAFAAVCLLVLAPVLVLVGALRPVSPTPGTTLSNPMPGPGAPTPGPGATPSGPRATKASTRVVPASTKIHRDFPIQWKSSWPESIGSCSNVGWPTEVSLAIGSTPLSMLVFEMENTADDRLEVLISVVSHDKGRVLASQLLQSVLSSLRCDFRTASEAFNADKMPLYRSPVDMVLLKEDQAQGFLAAKLSCPLLDLGKLDEKPFFPSRAEALQMTPHQWDTKTKRNRWLHWQLVLLRNSSESGSNWLAAPSTPLCNTTSPPPQNDKINDWNTGPSLDDFRAREDEAEKDIDVEPVTTSLCIFASSVSETYRSWTESSIKDWIFYQRSILGFSSIYYLDTNGEELLVARPELRTDDMLFAGFEHFPHTAMHMSMARLMSVGPVAEALAKERCSVLARKQRVKYVFLVKDPMDLLVPMKRRKGLVAQSLGRAVKDGCAGEIEVASIPWSWPPNASAAADATGSLSMISLYLTSGSPVTGRLGTRLERHSFFPAKWSPSEEDGEGCRRSTAFTKNDLLVLAALLPADRHAKAGLKPQTEGMSDLQQMIEASDPLKWLFSDVAAWVKHLLSVEAHLSDRQLRQRRIRPGLRDWIPTGKDDTPFTVHICRPGPDFGPLYGEARVVQYDAKDPMPRHTLSLTIYNAEVDRGPTGDGPRVLRMSVYAEDQESILYTFHNDGAWGVLHQSSGMAQLVPNITCAFSPVKSALDPHGSLQSIRSEGAWKMFTDVLSWIECPLPLQMPSVNAWDASSLVSLHASVGVSKVQVHTIRPVKLCIGSEEKGNLSPTYGAPTRTCDSVSVACRVGCIDDARSPADPQAMCCNRCHEPHHRYRRFDERDFWVPTTSQQESIQRDTVQWASSFLDGRDISICLRPFFMESACIECDGMQPLSPQRLIEWIEYHLLIGFDVIYVLDRFGYSLLPLLRHYIDSGRVIHVPFPLLTDTSLSAAARSNSTKVVPSFHDQVMAYDFCMSIGRRRDDSYMALVDLDEFVRYPKRKAGGLRDSLEHLLVKHWDLTSSSALPESIVLERYDFKVQGEGFATGYTQRAKEKRAKTNGAAHGKFLVRPGAMVRGGPMLHEAFNASGSKDRVRIANPTGTNALLVSVDELSLFHYREEERRTWIPNPSIYNEQQMVDDLSLQWAHELLSTQFIATSGWKAANGLAKQGLLSLSRGRRRTSDKRKKTPNRSDASNIEDERPSLFIGVLSYCAGRDRRNAIRQTWLSKDVLESLTGLMQIQVKFVLGKTPDHEKSKWCSSRALRSEASTFGDLLFFDNVEESYQVLTRKVLEIFRWADSHVNSSFVFKTDDDSYVNLPSLVDGLLQVDDPELPMYSGWHLAEALPVWLSTSLDAAGDGRWYIKPEDLPVDTQMYAQGAGYLLSRPLVQYLANISSDNGIVQLPWNPESRMGWLEDAAVGLLLRGAINRASKVSPWPVMDCWFPLNCISDFDIAVIHHVDTSQQIEIHRSLMVGQEDSAGKCLRLKQLQASAQNKMVAVDPAKRVMATKYGGSILDRPSSQVLNMSPPFQSLRTGVTRDTAFVDLPYGRDVIVITGGCRNIGHELIRAIQGGLSGMSSPITILLVDVAVDNPTCEFTDSVQTRYLGLTIESVRLDITEYSSLRDTLKPFATRIRGVVHLAAVSRVQDCQSDLPRCEAVNVGGTENILRAMSELYRPERTGNETNTSPLPWLVFASSREVYGGLARGEVVSESSPMRPLNPYGDTKMKAEVAIRQWSRRTGFNAIVLRFTNVYGSCFDHKARLVPAVVSRLLAGKEIIVFGSEDKTISLLHVQDAVQSLLLGIRFASSVLDNGAGVYEAFNIGGGPNHDAFNIMEIIEIAGSRLNALMPNSADWRQLISVARNATGRAPEPDHFRFTVSKAFRILGYRHSRGYDENSVTTFVHTCYGVSVSARIKTLKQLDASSTTASDTYIQLRFPNDIMIGCSYLCLFMIIFLLRMRRSSRQMRLKTSILSFWNCGYTNSSVTFTVSLWVAVVLWYSVGVLCIATSKILLSSNIVSPLTLTLQQLLIGSMLLRFLLLIKFMGSAGIQPAEQGFVYSVMAVMSGKQLSEGNREIFFAATFFSLGFLATNIGFSSSTASFVETVKAAEPLTSAAVAAAYGIEVITFPQGVSLGTLFAGVLLSIVGHGDSVSSQEGVEAFKACCVVMTANLCFSFRGLCQKIFREQGGVLDDLNLLFRMQWTGVLLLGIPTMMICGVQAVWSGNYLGAAKVAGTASSFEAPLRYCALAFLNGCAFMCYNLASTYILSRISVVHHAALNCIRRIFAINVTILVFGIPLTLRGAFGIFIATLGFMSYTYYKVNDQQQSSLNDNRLVPVWGKERVR